MRRLLAALLLLLAVPAAAQQLTGPPPIATTVLRGTVKCDGTTIACAADGTISTIGAPPTGAAGGDLGGAYPNPTVVSGAHLSGSLASGLTIPSPNITGVTGAIKAGSPIAQAACADLSNAGAFCAGTSAGSLTGTLNAAQMPALTGDCTTSAGAVATTCTKTGGVSFGALATAVQGQVPGIATNTAATAGNIGEVKTINVLVGSEVSLSSGTAASINGATGLSLTAGHWQCSGVVNFDAAAGTTVGNIGAAINTAQGNFAVANQGFIQLNEGSVAGATINPIGIPVPPIDVLISSNTTYFLNVFGTFAVSTLKAYGGLLCTRVQ